MANFQLTQFSVFGLHGDVDIVVPIRDNRLVIVGVNGLGKSTFLNLLYYVISRQWQKLLEYDFREILADFVDAHFRITREDVEVYIAMQRELLVRRDPRFPVSRYHALIDRLANNPSLFDRVLADRHFTGEVRSNDLVALGLSSRELDWLSESVKANPGFFDASLEMRRLGHYLNDRLAALVLFLPTYRRIEKDLHAILPGLEEELKRYHEVRRRSRSRVETHYLELVEFGMEDVEDTIRSTLVRLGGTARSELNSLAGSYLRDVIRGEGQTFDRELISSFSLTDMDEVLGRVEERTLDETDKQHLRSVVDRIRNREGITPREEYVAHYLAKLLLIGATLKDDEVDVTQFVSVCNQYLEGKQLVYNGASYEVSINRADGKPIEMKHLSSGEKQIVSLFSQIYLGPSKSYAVIIDEPELSLSVGWQKRLLPDIVASGRCAFVAAVTHSPFIFDNELDPYAVNLLDHVAIKP